MSHFRSSTVGGNFFLHIKSSWTKKSFYFRRKSDKNDNRCDFPKLSQPLEIGLFEMCEKLEKPLIHEDKISY